MKKLTIKQVQKAKDKSIKRGYTRLEMTALKGLKIGEGLTFKIGKNYKDTQRNRWYEYAKRVGIKVKVFLTADLFLVVERIK